MTPKLNLIETRINQADGEIEKENAVEFEVVKTFSYIKGILLSFSDGSF